MRRLPSAWRAGRGRLLSLNRPRHAGDNYTQQALSLKPNRPQTLEIRALAAIVFNLRLARLARLALLLLRRRVAHLRTIGKMGVVPSFFNINEPILFGAPIIMNPMMFIPFVFVPMINAVLAYGATRLGWLSQVVSLTPWTTPAPIGASWAANWTLSPVVMCVICMVMSAVIYLPFLRAYERSLMKTEVEKAKNAAPVAETVS